MLHFCCPCLYKKFQGRPFHQLILDPNFSNVLIFTILMNYDESDEEDDAAAVAAAAIDMKVEFRDGRGTENIFNCYSLDFIFNKTL